MHTDIHVHVIYMCMPRRVTISLFTQIVTACVSQSAPVVGSDVRPALH